VFVAVPQQKHSLPTLGKRKALRQDIGTTCFVCWSSSYKNLVMVITDFFSEAKLQKVEHKKKKLASFFVKTGEFELARLVFQEVRNFC
jgi:hypothetical protein